jgi:hypothetical protein
MKSSVKISIGLMISGIIISFFSKFVAMVGITDVNSLIIIFLITLAISLSISIAGFFIFLKNIHHKTMQSYKDGKLMLIGAIAAAFIPHLFSLIGLLTGLYFLSAIAGVLMTFSLNYILALALIYFGVKMLLKLNKTEMENDSIGISSDPLPNSGEKLLLKKTVFSYIGIALVSLLFTATAFVLFMDTYHLDTTENILPKDCFKSNFFWFLLIVGTIIAIVKVGFTSYRPLFKGSDGKIYESLDMGDQMGSGILTLLSPVLVGALVALIPYYLLRWLFNLAENNVFLLAGIFIIP